jgi:hypothetical protein
MRIGMIASVFTFSVFAFSGCAVDGTPTTTDEATETSQDALTKFERQFVGEFTSESNPREFAALTLKKNGKYVADTGIRCIKAPCPSGESGAWKAYAATKRTRRRCV